MPLTTASISSGNVGPELPRKRPRLTVRQLTLTDLPHGAMVIVKASLSGDDIRTLRLVSREVCSLVTACLKEMTMDLEDHDKVESVERALERFKGVPQLSVEVSFEDAHLLWSEGVLPRMQGLYLWGSAAGEPGEVARILQRATRLTSIYITNVKINEGLRLAANCQTLERLELIPKIRWRSPSPVDFRLVSGLSNLQSLSAWDYGNLGNLSSITCLTGLTHLYIHVGRGVSLHPLAHLPRLVSLEIHYYGHGKLPEDFVFSCLAAECRSKLKSLKLLGFGGATAEAVRQLALCTSLVCLEIVAGDLPCLADIEPMLKGLPHLKECSWKDESWRRC